MAGGVNTLGNLLGKVDSNNALVVALSSGSVLPSDVEVAAGSGTAEAGIGGVLTVSTTQAQTGANTDETDLWTYSLPANTLSTNGYGIRVTVTGSFASNGNTKTLRVYFGGTAIYNLAQTTSGDGWRIVAEVYRTGAATQLGDAFGARGVNGTFTPAPVTPAETLSGAVTVRMSGQNGTANAGDIVFRRATVEFLRPGS